MVAEAVPTETVAVPIEVVRPPVGLRRLVAGVNVMGSVIAASALAACVAGGLGEGEPEKLALLLVLVIAADVLPLRLRFGSHQVLHVWGEFPLVFGLALVPLPGLLVVTWLGGLVGYAAARLERRKAVYNASTSTLGTLLAGGLVWLLDGTLPHPGTLTLRNLLGLAVATVALSVFVDIVISAAIARAQRVPLRVVVQDGFALHQLMCLTNGAVALGAIYFGGTSQPWVLVLPLLLGGLHLLQYGGVRVAQEREAWQRLDVATRELNQLNRRAVIEQAIGRACELFRSDAVEVVLGQGDLRRVIAGTMSGVLPENSASFVPRTVIARPLEASEAQIGELRLCFAGRVRLSEREAWVLSTFSHALSAALLNAELYEDLQQHAETKAHEAEHDLLTGLANRAILTRRGDQILTATGSRRVAALLLLDLDHFKQVNDTLGHDAGDQVLREVARRLVGAVRSGDTVVRLGGDEFALLLPDLATADDAVIIAASVLTALREPVIIDGLGLQIEASVGVACAPADGRTVRDLLRCADLAMYSAKGSPQSVRRYRPQDAIGTLDRLALVSELHTALGRGELILLFQPKIDLRTGRVLGAEALSRWRRPHHGLLSACEFIPVIEQSSMVHDFALHVLDLALRAARTWGDGPDAPDVAVNLSARNLLDRNLPRDVAAALERYGVAPRRLIVEITETVVMSELEVVDEVLAELRRLGVQLSVDDFGTGFSSLTFLSRVNVDEVKVDRSFVAAMLGSPGDAAIVRAVLELGRSFGLRVVAEGVESEAQREHLISLGCISAQGFHLGRPMSAEGVASLLDLPDGVAAIPA